MGKSLPGTVLDATLAGWESVQITCSCGRGQTVPLASVNGHGPDLLAYAQRLRCKTCGAAPSLVRLHPKVMTNAGGEICLVYYLMRPNLDAVVIWNLPSGNAG